MFLKVYARKLCKKDTDTGQMDKSQEAVSAFVIAGSNATKFLQELQEKYLHQMTFLVEPPIHAPGIRFIALGRDAEISADIGDELPQFPFSVGFVG